MEPWEADVRVGTTRPRCGHGVGWKETLFFLKGLNVLVVRIESGKKKLMEQDTLTGRRKGSWSWKLVRDTDGSYGS